MDMVYYFLMLFWRRWYKVEPCSHTINSLVDINKCGRVINIFGPYYYSIRNRLRVFNAYLLKMNLKKMIVRKIQQMTSSLYFKLTAYRFGTEGWVNILKIKTFLLSLQLLSISSSVPPEKLLRPISFYHSFWWDVLTENPDRKEMKIIQPGN